MPIDLPRYQDHIMQNLNLLDLNFHVDSTQPVDFTALIGKPTVMYFYPKDNTPGCTSESKDFRDLYQQFQALDAVILGVSRDTLKSHEKFRDKYQLPFPLIADTEETLCQHFDVIKEKSMFGKKVRGIVRSTFVFDREGKLFQHWHKVKVTGHAQNVLEALKTMPS